MSYLVGQVGYASHTVVDTNDDPVTGLTGADFGLTLLRGAAVAVETVAVVEVDAVLNPGVYAFVTDPFGAPGALWLEGRELATFPLSREATFDAAWDVVDAGAAFAPAAADAFCALSDVERYAGTPYTPTSRPSDAEVLGFMAERASYLVAAMREVGYRATPASGGSPVDVSTDDGRTLAGMLRNACAVGAAASAKRAAFLGQPPNESVVPQILEGIWLGLAGGYDPVSRRQVDGAIPRFCRLLLALSLTGTDNPAVSRTHVSAGEVAAYRAPYLGESVLRFRTGKERW